MNKLNFAHLMLSILLFECHLKQYFLLLQRKHEFLTSSIYFLIVHFYVYLSIHLHINIFIFIFFFFFSLQQSFNREYNMNIYSAHDYTILSVLGALGIMGQLSQPSQFGCFLVFELWDRKENEMIEITEMTEKYDNSKDTILLINGNEIRNNGNNGGNIPVECADDNGNSGSHGINGTKGQHSNGHKNSNIHGNLGSNSIKNDGNAKHAKYTANDNEETLLMKKSRKILKNNFLSETNSNDNRFLRIFANFSPFTGGEYSIIHPSVAQVNEENLQLISELNIEEIKIKHNILYESLTSRGFFSPCQNGV